MRREHHILTLSMELLKARLVIRRTSCGGPSFPRKAAFTSATRASMATLSHSPSLPRMITSPEVTCNILVGFSLRELTSRWNCRHGDITHGPPQTYIQQHEHRDTRTHTHTRTHAHKRMHTQTHARAHTHTRTHTYTHTHTCAAARTQDHPCMHKRTGTHRMR